jgi:hypothetical protein
VCSFCSIYHGGDFDEIVRGVERFLASMAKAMETESETPETWTAPGPWK